MIGRRSNVLKETQLASIRGGRKTDLPTGKALSTDQNTTEFSRKKSLPQKPAGK